MKQKHVRELREEEKSKTGKTVQKNGNKNTKGKNR